MYMPFLSLYLLGLRRVSQELSGKVSPTELRQSERSLREMALEISAQKGSKWETNGTRGTTDVWLIHKDGK